MPIAEPHRLPATTLARLIDSGELTAEAVIQSCLERIREREPVVRAWTHLADAAALAAAPPRQERRRGVLGRPFGIKDIRHGGHARRMGSPIYTGCRRL